MCLWVSIQSAGDLMSQTSKVRILHSAEEDDLSPFNLKIACLYQSIKINNKKHVYRQSHVRKPTGSEPAECSLIIGTGYRVQIFNLILDSSVGLWVGIQSLGDLVCPTSKVRILHSAEADNLSPFYSKIACLCQSIKFNNKHVKHTWTKYVTIKIAICIQLCFIWYCLKGPILLIGIS